MSKICPFRALRPSEESAPRVSSVPYDVVSTDEARALAADNPLSFLHVTRAELERAAALGLDYALLGAVKTTPSHPERAALGWKAFAEMAGRLPMPVFALGGLGADDLCDAKAAGAHGIAPIRAVWKD